MDKSEVMYRATEGGADQDDLGLGVSKMCTLPVACGVSVISSRFNRTTKLALY